MTKKDLHELLNEAISVLQTDREKAERLLYPYVPVNGPVAVDYGIYSMQYALLFYEDVHKKNADKDKSMPVKVASLFEECKTKNNKEYLNLLAWISNEHHQITEQMKRASVNLHLDTALYEALSELSIINPTKVQKLVYSLQMPNPSHHLLANSYKDMYEISFYLELLANLLIISKGGKFSKNPFVGLKINGTLIVQKKRLVKGLAINWLSDNADPFLKSIIESSYNSTLRNIIGGHNDYVYDSEKEIYKSKDGTKEFKYPEVYATLSNLELLFSALRLDGITRFFEDTKHPAKIYEIGFMDWRPKLDSDEILVVQYWSNFSARSDAKSINEIAFYRTPFNEEKKTISLGFNNLYITPYDLRVIANDKSLLLMKELFTKEKLNLVLVSVVPKVSPFTNFSKATITIADKELLVVNEIRAEVTINKPALVTLIKYLES